MLLGAEGSYLDVVGSARGLFIDDGVCLVISGGWLASSSESASIRPGVTPSLGVYGTYEKDRSNGVTRVWTPRYRSRARACVSVPLSPFLFRFPCHTRRHALVHRQPPDIID